MYSKFKTDWPSLASIKDSYIFVSWNAVKYLFMLTTFVFSSSSLHAEKLSIECNLLTITRENKTSDLSHLEYHYDLVIDHENKKISKFIPAQNFFMVSQRWENMNISLGTENNADVIFSRIAVNDSYPNQENNYLYLLTNNMRSLIVDITQYEVLPKKKIKNKYSRKYQCQKK